MGMDEILQKIQCELKAPKDKFNKFGGYKYRSCEAILEAVKPLLKKYGATVTLSDELVLIGERYYIKATAAFNDSVKVTAYAREAKEKKGMDESQITGTASSYARKYALNGLFAIDDTKDADTEEFAKQQGKESEKQEERKPDIVDAMMDAGDPEAEVKEILTRLMRDQIPTNVLTSLYTVIDVKDIPRKDQHAILRRWDEFKAYYERQKTKKEETKEEQK